MQQRNVEQVIVSQGKCYSCFSCMDICPVNSIQLKTDELGTMYPSVSDSCLNCGACLRVCPVENPVSRFDIHEGYAAVAKEDNPASASGSAFCVLAEFMLRELNAVVYGMAFDSNLKAVTQRVDNEMDLGKLLGSKYVRGTAQGNYQKVKEDLLANRKVLFSGTPCQIAALKAYLGKEYSELFCVDIICHGTPNQKLFDNYILWLENKHGKSVSNYRFRTKRGKDRDGYDSEVTFSNGDKKYIWGKYDPYYGNFLDEKIFHQVCYSCEYASPGRVGDITIGDWASRGQSTFFDFRAASSILINSEKGMALWEKIKDKFDCIPISVEKEVSMNAQLSAPSDESHYRKDICLEMMAGKFDKLAKNRKKLGSRKRRMYEMLLRMIPFKRRKQIIHFIKGFMHRN